MNTGIARFKEQTLNTWFLWNILLQSG